MVDLFNDRIAPILFRRRRAPRRSLFGMFVIGLFLALGGLFDLSDPFLLFVTALPLFIGGLSAPGAALVAASRLGLARGIAGVAVGLVAFGAIIVRWNDIFAPGSSRIQTSATLAACGFLFLGLAVWGLVRPDRSNDDEA